jgi:hypothetical protein
MAWECILTVFHGMVDASAAMAGSYQEARQSDMAEDAHNSDQFRGEGSHLDALCVEHCKLRFLRLQVWPTSCTLAGPAVLIVAALVVVVNVSSLCTNLDTTDDRW